jgi:hypothetical protein
VEVRVGEKGEVEGRPESEKFFSGWKIRTMSLHRVLCWRRKRETSEQYSIFLHFSRSLKGWSVRCNLHISSWSDGILKFIVWRFRAYVTRSGIFQGSFWNLSARKKSVSFTSSCLFMRWGKVYLTRIQPRVHRALTLLMEVKLVTFQNWIQFESWWCLWHLCFW